MKKWKVAIVGCGAIAEDTYMAQMSKNVKAEVVACCDIKPERTALFQAKFGIPEAYSSLEEMLEDEYLLALAVEHKKHDNGIRWSFEEILAEDRLTIEDIERMLEEEDVEIG